jgi:hypothetical protein
MRKIMTIGATCLALAACSKGAQQADALDRAASQSDPTAAAELRNQADTIRDGSDGSNVADPNSPAQNALQSAGNAAAGSGGPHANTADAQAGTTR